MLSGLLRPCSATRQVRAELLLEGEAILAHSFSMKESDSTERGRRQGIGATLLLVAESDPVRAYFLLKQLGLRIADLQEAGFTETDLKPLMRGWREVQRRISLAAGEEPNVVPRAAAATRH